MPGQLDLPSIMPSCQARCSLVQLGSTAFVMRAEYHVNKLTSPSNLAVSDIKTCTGLQVNLLGRAWDQASRFGSREWSWRAYWSQVRPGEVRVPGQGRGVS